MEELVTKLTMSFVDRRHTTAVVDVKILRGAKCGVRPQLGGET